MNIHEYQAKDLLTAYGLPVPEYQVISNPWEAYDAAMDLSADAYVVKAQIHAGGRGKAGGVKLAHSPEEVHEIAAELHGKTLVTPQTGPEGKLVRKLLISAAVDIAKEYYLALLIDRADRSIAIMASKSGGVDIEQVAATAPEKIVTKHVNLQGGLSPFAARSVAFDLGLPEEEVDQLAQIVTKLYRLFVEKDCSLIEINPVVVDKKRKLWCADAKVVLDDNGLARHKDLRKLRDYDEEEPLEILARRYGVDYVKLDGAIGCLVNGAGLAMATMDQIKVAGGEPANFLDIKGGANKENVINAFRLLTADKRVKAVLINIFGGIVRCDMVAAGILAALDEVKVELPIVVRLEGTNVEEGRRLLDAAPYNFMIAEGLADAARKAVAALAGGGQ